MKNFIKEYAPCLLAVIAGYIIAIMVHNVKEGLKDVEPESNYNVLVLDGDSLRPANINDYLHKGFCIEVFSNKDIPGYITIKGRVENINTKW